MTSSHAGVSEASGTGLEPPASLDSRLSDSDRSRLERWNDTDRAYDLNTTVHALVEQEAKRRPDAVAVSSPESGVAPELTFRELHERSDALAARLQELGIETDVPVAVSMERSAELVVALVAVLRAGGAYVPVDPVYPAERRAFMLSDSEAPVVLTQEHLVPDLPDSGGTVLAVDSLWPGLTGGSPEPSGTPSSLAYIIYTSGSTGRPKGVMLEHRSVVNRLLWTQEHFGLTEEDVVLQKTPYSFDVSVWEFFWPLIVGCRLVMARPEGHTDGAYLAELIEREGVTMMHFVPSMLELFLEVDGVGARCGTLENVICSGEALPPSAVEQFHRLMHDSVELWNLYGPTEAAVDVTWWHCERGRDDTTVPIGRPVANTRVHIVDGQDRLVPVGESGELLIGGAQVGRGYWRRPELTAEKFIPDPFAEAEEDDARLYRTGDLASWREDGAIEFLGRIDSQVKLRGQRIELGEIEEVLRRQPGVTRAAVIVREDRPDDRRLVAYVVPEEPERFSRESLRSGLGEMLPEVMVPSHFVPMEEMPLLPNGKLDRSSLPEPSRERPDLGRPYTPPRSPLEEHLVDVWGDILGMEKVGIHDPVFELGGTSLHAARFVNRLQEELDEFIYVVTVFDAPTVAAYAEFLAEDYPSTVADRFGEEVVERLTAPDDRRTGDDRESVVDEDAIRRLEAAVPRFEVASRTDGGARNESAIFVLAPPRSGTTLLRVMLAGHPDLFAGTELQLLHFESLAQRREAFSGRHRVWLEGTVRAVMELLDQDADEAWETMEELEDEDLPVADFYARLHGWADGRTLVDKSPSYAMDPGALRRAERDFERPLYIHLVRHPYAAAESMVSYHMDQILYLDDHPFDPRQLAELVWLVSHRNIGSHLEAVPEDRQARLQFESLVREPEREMRDLCDRFGLEWVDRLVRPYEGIEDKMVDGVHDDSTPMGDTHLLEREGIDPSVADSWKGVLEDDYLSERTWRMAEALGYDRPETETGEQSGTSDAARRGAMRKQALADRRRRE